MAGCVSGRRPGTQHGRRHCHPVCRRPGADFARGPAAPLRLHAPCRPHLLRSCIQAPCPSAASPPALTPLEWQVAPRRLVHHPCWRLRHSHLAHCLAAVCHVCRLCIHLRLSFACGQPRSGQLPRAHLRDPGGCDGELQVSNGVCLRWHVESDVTRRCRQLPGADIGGQCVRCGTCRPWGPPAVRLARCRLLLCSCPSSVPAASGCGSHSCLPHTCRSASPAALPCPSLPTQEDCSHGAGAEARVPGAGPCDLVSRPHLGILNRGPAVACWPPHPTCAFPLPCA